MAVITGADLQLDYDAQGDVLYATFGPLEPAVSFQIHEHVDVFLRYVPPSRRVVGIFILDFLRNFPNRADVEFRSHVRQVVTEFWQKYPKIPE